MTIIEVMVVVAILGLLAGGLVMGLGAGRQAQLMRATNQVAGTVRFAFNKARVTGTYYRLHIDFEKRTFSLQSADERMYMPSTNRDGSIEEYDEDAEVDKVERDEKAAESYFSSIQGRMMGMIDGEDMNPYAVTAEKVPRRRAPLFSNFAGEGTLSGLGTSIELPDGVEIVSVRTEHDHAAITEKEASLYFFPQGRTQLAHIQLRKKGSEEGEEGYTVIVEPLTGRVRVEGELVDLKLPRDVLDGEDSLGRSIQRRSF
jgi:general secretion pathway protein H